MTRFAVFLTLASLAALPAPASSADLSRFEGKFIGCAVSSGEWVPVATTFTVTSDGLSGSYIFIEKGQWFSGTLGYKASDGDARINLTWSDIYGSGGAIFDFSSDADRFDGLWTSEDGNAFPWNVVRQGAGLPQPDCTTPVA